MEIKDICLDYKDEDGELRYELEDGAHDMEKVDGFSAEEFYLNLDKVIIEVDSIKAKGIAIELFGTDKNYVVPVQSFTNPYHLQNAFIWLIDNSQSIKKHLESIMPAYKESIMKARELLFA